jgi:predicted RNA binding protein YcfA (HicA-like mRNA interferase family)
LRIGLLASVRAVRTIHTVNSLDLIAELKGDGWTVDRVSGSHHMFKHAAKLGTVVVPHPKKDLGKGLVNAIRKQAGLK